MTEIYTNKEVASALVLFIVALLGALAAIVRLIPKYFENLLDRKLENVTKHVETTRKVAEGAEREARLAKEEVQNDHSSNLRDDVDASIETTWLAVNAIEDVKKTLGSVTSTLSENGSRLEDTSRTVRGLVRRVDELSEQQGSLLSQQERLREDLRLERLEKTKELQILREQSHDEHERLWRELGSN